MSDVLRELSDEARAFRDARAWGRFHTPKNLAMALGIESGELAELFLWKDDAEIAARLEEPGFRARVGHELADVLVLLLLLGDATGVDLAAAVREKLALNAEKYPVERAYGHARKYDEL